MTWGFLAREILGVLGEAQRAVGSSGASVERDQSASWCVLGAHCPLQQGMGYLMVCPLLSQPSVGTGIESGWGGVFAEALQYGDALPRSRSGEATCLLGNLAGDLAFLWISYCSLALSRVVDLHSEGFTLAVLCPSLCMYIWCFFWATCSAVLTSAFIPQAWSLAGPQHGPLLEEEIRLASRSCASSSAWSHQAPSSSSPLRSFPTWGACWVAPTLGTCSLAVSSVLTRSPCAPFSSEIPKYAIPLRGTHSSGSASQHIVHPFHLAQLLHILMVCWVRRLDGRKTRLALMPPWSCMMCMFGVCFRARFLNQV